MVGMRGWKSMLRRGAMAGVAIALSFSLLACSGTPQRTAPPTGKDSTALVGRLSEVSPPSLIQELRQDLEQYQPQVKILSPRSDEVLQDQEVSVRFQINDLPLFKNEEFGLGPHLHVILDNQPYQAVYSTDSPLILTDLTPGTHTLRVFASRPWHESFKNEGAYAQVTFHVFAKTGEHQPQSNSPLLTYSRPQGSYGAEPVMLDFYLTNAPLHLVAQENPDDDIRDWRVKCTVNGESFLFDSWEPIYLKGLKPGKNWVQLELVDEKGVAIANTFNNTVRIIDYEPGGTDTLSKLTRGELAIAEVRSIVDPNYTPPEPEPEPIPEPEPELEIIPEPEPEPSLEVTPEPEIVPTPEPSPVPSPAGIPAIPTPEPPPVEAPELEQEPASEPEIAPKQEPTPEAVPPSLEEPTAPVPVPVAPAPAPPIPAGSTPEKSRGARGFLERLRERVPVPAIQRSPTPVPAPSIEEESSAGEPLEPKGLAPEEQATPETPVQQSFPEESVQRPPDSAEPQSPRPNAAPKPTFRSYLERFRRTPTESPQSAPSVQSVPAPVEQPAITPQTPEGAIAPPPVAPTVPSTPPVVQSSEPVRPEPPKRPTVPAPTIQPSPEATRPVPLPAVAPSVDATQAAAESFEDRIRRAVEERRRARLSPGERSPSQGAAEMPPSPPGPSGTNAPLTPTP